MKRSYENVIASQQILERSVKRARPACSEAALCAVCESIDARVRLIPEPLSEMTGWLLDSFVSCTRARQTFLAAYRSSNSSNLPTDIPATQSISIDLDPEPEEIIIPAHTDLVAWKNASGYPQRVAALQRLFTPDTNTQRMHPRQARIRTDFTSTRHDYYIDNVLSNARNGWYSVSGLLHFLFPAFDAAGKSRMSAEAALRELLSKDLAPSDRDRATPLSALWARAQPPLLEALQTAFPFADEKDDKLVKDGPLPLLAEVVAAKGPVDTLVAIGAKSLRAGWDRNRDRGSDKHAWYDAWLQHRKLPATADGGEANGEAALSAVPLGFFRAMAMLVEQGYDVEGTEVSIFDEGGKFLGQVDALMRHRHTGRCLLVDFKNCKDVDLAVAGNPRGFGMHPLTAGTPDTKLEHYRIQLGAYWFVLDRHYYAGQMEPRALLLNFRPSEPDQFYAYWIDTLPGMCPLWDLLPWQPDDPRHTAFAPGRGAPLLVQPVPDADPRCCGPTTRCAAPALPTPADVVWTGAMYPSAKARADAQRAGKPLRFDLPDSIYKHPWRWFGPPKAGAYEFYEQHFLGNSVLLATLPELVGKRIACWCKSPDERCQADVLVKYANLYHHGAITLPKSITDFFL